MVSNLQPAVTLLDKGLDLQSPKIIAPAGSVLDSLNYEQVDFQGQKRIDGYARYDGSLIPAFDDYVVVRVLGITNHPSLEESNVVYVDGEIWGMLLNQTSDQELHIAVINHKLEPKAGSTITVDGQSSPLTGYIGGSMSGILPDLHYENLLSYMELVRSRVQELPGPIAGLHWFRDRLYAVAGMLTITLTGGGQLLTGDSVIINGVSLPVLSGVDGKIVVGGTIATDISVGESVQGPNGYVGDIADIVYSEDASFFESRSEQQAILEDGPEGKWGWKFVHLGWRVEFKNGLSPYGDLAALNQNRTGVGIQGPTSIADDSGRPLTLIQKVAISGAPTQVNGWKSSSSRTSYSINATDVRTQDSTYVYADAYISWTGDGGVTATGLDMQNLIENSATNTVTLDT